jgi:exopolysaccharide biosynthesis polyprenyl glycosylphosphotransferase
MKIYLPKKQLMLLCGDVILILASLYLAPVIRFGIFMDPSFVYEATDIITIAVYLLIFYVFDFYNLEEPKDFRYILRFFLSITIATVLISAIFYIFHVRPGSVVLIVSSILIFLSLIVWRYIFDGLFKNNGKTRRVLIVGAGQGGSTLYEFLKTNTDYEVVGFLDDDEKKWGISFSATSVIGGTDILPSVVKQRKVDKVIIAITRVIQPEVYKRLVEAKFSGVAVYEMPSFYEKFAGKIPVLHTNEMWLGYADIYGVKSNLYNVKVKKIIDKSFAVLGLIIALPLMCLISILIKMDSRGPVFYRQQRVGFNGLVFDLIKFRSMRDGADTEREFAGNKNDPRITRLGHIIRLFRMDEIPQLWNVFKGDMSFIGPRALMAEEVQTFTSKIPYFNLRQSIRPGITGWAQINYPHGTLEKDALEKLQYDLYYIKNVTFLLDFYIVLRTIRTVLFGKGAR